MSESEFRTYLQAAINLRDAMRRFNDLRALWPEGIEKRCTPNQITRMSAVEKEIDEAAGAPY